MCRWFNSSPAHCFKVLAAKHLRLAAFFVGHYRRPQTGEHATKGLWWQPEATGTPRLRRNAESSRPCSLALRSTGKSIPISKATIAITTNSSIKVNARRLLIELIPRMEHRSDTDIISATSLKINGLAWQAVSRPPPACPAPVLFPRVEKESLSPRAAVGRRWEGLRVRAARDERRDVETRY